jgi:hypothetical protein
MVGRIKLNLDAAVNQKKSLMEVGILPKTIWVLASMCYVDKYISDPTIAEAIGARLGAE